AGKYALRPLAATADLQLKHHGAARRVFKLQASLVDALGQRSGVEPVRAPLRRAPEDVVALRQQHGTDRHRLGAVEIDVGEAVADRAQLDANVHVRAVESLGNPLAVEPTLLPLGSDRFLGLAR